MFTRMCCEYLRSGIRLLDRRRGGGCCCCCCCCAAGSFICRGEDAVVVDRGVVMVVFMVKLGNIASIGDGCCNGECTGCPCPCPCP